MEPAVFASGVGMDAVCLRSSAQVEQLPSAIDIGGWLVLRRASNRQPFHPTG
jgi:hypothetical protein